LVVIGGFAPSVGGTSCVIAAGRGLREFDTAVMEKKQLGLAAARIDRSVRPPATLVLV
jgi:hypothetical protein